MAQPRRMSLALSDPDEEFIQPLPARHQVFCRQPAIGQRRCSAVNRPVNLARVVADQDQVDAGGQCLAGYFADAEVVDRAHVEVVGDLYAVVAPVVALPAWPARLRKASQSVASSAGVSLSRAGCRWVSRSPRPKPGKCFSVPRTPLVARLSRWPAATSATPSGSLPMARAGMSLKISPAWPVDRTQVDHRAEVEIDAETAQRQGERQ